MAASHNNGLSSCRREFPNGVAAGRPKGRAFTSARAVSGAYDHLVIGLRAIMRPTTNPDRKGFLMGLRRLLLLCPVGSRRLRGGAETVGRPTAAVVTVAKPAQRTIVDQDEYVAASWP